MKRKRVVRRVLLVLLIAVLVFVISSVAFSAVFFQVMFARRDSLAENVCISYRLIDSQRYRRRAVSFLSGENRLSGFFYGEDNHGGLVIIAPGISSDADAHLPEIMRFADSGFTVLAYDATGTCQSEGDSRVGLQQSKRDLSAAIDYARQEKGDTPLFLYGHSLGGYAAAAVLEDAEADAVIALSGFDSPVGTMHGKAKEYVGVLADIEYPFLWLQNYFVFGDDADSRALDGVNTGDTPVMIVHGSEDKVIPYDLSLYAHAEKADNPRVFRTLIDDRWRNGHSYQWLSADAARYVAQLQDELNDLREACGGELPEEVLDDFYSHVDAARATQTDAAFMDAVCGFFERSVH